MSPRVIHRFVLNCNNTKCGPDGIGVSAWKAAGLYGSEILYSIYRSMADSMIIPWDLNFLNKAFIPKKETKRHLHGVAVEPTKTRPLGLKNSDVKAISGSVGYCIMPVICKFAHVFQNGFISGRNFVENVLFLDAAARVAALDQDVMISAAMCLFDFFSAFPSVAHEYIFKVCARYGMPSGILRAVRGGVIQGDPIARLGHVRACADDVGVVISSVKGLEPLARAFAVIAKAANLRLSIPKCILIP
eukprot:6889042-Karenia_brevis.AAC.1